MASLSVEKRVGQVVKVLGELKRLHDELAVVLKGKLEAMRKANTDALRSATTREEFLLQRIREQDGLRQQLMDLVGELVGWPPGEARTATVSRLAGHVAEPLRSQLLALAAALRERVQETAESNRVAAMISGEMLRHFRRVFQTMAQGNPRQAGVYSRTGLADTRAATKVFEAVG